VENTVFSHEPVRRFPELSAKAMSALTELMRGLML